MSMLCIKGESGSLVSRAIDSVFGSSYTFPGKRREEMKRVISLALLVLMVLASISFAACTGGGGAPPTGGTTAPPSNEGTTPPSGGDTTPPPSGGGGFTWNDMPVYPGADQGEKAGWVPPLIEAEGEYRKVEVRYYGTEDSVSKVTSFYKSKMPGHG